jgi:hypothetical protein
VILRWNEPGTVSTTCCFLNPGKHLNAAARGVNMVWNHCNGAQRHALKHNTKWPTTRQLQRLTAGAGRLIGIPAQTVQSVCEEYIDRRRGSRKVKLRWRALGWVPFKNQTVRVVSSSAIKGHEEQERPSGPIVG